MKNDQLPAYPLPEPIRGLEPGSFAEHTIKVRLPAIGRRVIAENHLPSEVNNRLEELFQEIPYAHIRPLRDRSAPDTSAWDGYTAPYLDQDWLQVPWLFSETYFYRRIMEATGYFMPGPLEGYDPYSYQKQAGLDTARNQIQALAGRLAQWNQDAKGAEGFTQALISLLSTDLWGNQVDLSLWPAGQENRPDHDNADQADAFLLVDDRPKAAACLSKRPLNPGQVDFLADNAGFELVVDLCLADFLLSAGAASAIRFQLKPNPTYVSDALIKDVRHTILFLAGFEQAPVRNLGDRLSAYLQADRLQLRANFFSTSPLALWDMPTDMRQELAESGLVVLKGDYNYRRALGDRHWAPETPIDGILRYFPAPILLLRTLKSEIIAGLKPGQPKELSQKDPKWLTDGKWGVIQWGKG